MGLWLYYLPADCQETRISCEVRTHSLLINRVWDQFIFAACQLCWRVVETLFGNAIVTDSTQVAMLSFLVSCIWCKETCALYVCVLDGKVDTKASADSLTSFLACRSLCTVSAVFSGHQTECSDATADVWMTAALGQYLQFMLLIC